MGLKTTFGRKCGLFLFQSRGIGSRPKPLGAMKRKAAGEKSFADRAGADYLSAPHGGPTVIRLPIMSPTLSRPLFLSSFTAALLLAASGVAEADTLVSVDLGTSLQTGFTKWDIGTDGNGPRNMTFTISDFVSVPSGLLSATIAAGTDAANPANDISALNTRIRANAPANSGSFTQANLLNDRVVSPTAGTSLFLFLSGFAPSTTFTIQVWGFDTQNSPSTGAKPGNFTLLDRTNGGNTTIGSFTSTAGQLPTDNNTFSVVGNVTSDSMGRIVLQPQSNMDGTGIINGFVIATVPEPASGALLVSSLGLMALRRRRST